MSQYVTVGCPFMPGIITEKSSGKQVCCLFRRMVKERERLSYTGPFVIQGSETSEKGEVSESQVKHTHTHCQSTAGYRAVGRSEVKGISAKFVSPVWLRVHVCMRLVTVTQLPHRSVPGKTLTYLD